MRHLRAMKDRVAVPAATDTVTLADLASLPHRRPLAEVAALERRGVTFEGRVQRLLPASDGDLHFELAPPGAALDAPDRVALTAYATAEVTPAFRRRHPGWTVEGLARALRPNLGTETPWPGGPRLARVSGWLCYDHQYDDPVPDSLIARGAPRVTGWEIHPVTRIEVFDAALGAWSEVGP
jgi:hypothetical protein